MRVTIIIEEGDEKEEYRVHDARYSFDRPACVAPGDDGKHAIQVGSAWTVSVTGTVDPVRDVMDE